MDLLGVTFSLGAVFFRRGKVEFGTRGYRPLRILKPIRERCSKVISAVKSSRSSIDYLDICGSLFKAFRKVRGLDPCASARIRESWDWRGEGIVFHRAFQLTRTDYLFGLSSLRVQAPTLMRNDGSTGRLPDWSDMALAFREVLERELKGEMPDDSWRSRFFAEVYLLYRSEVPFRYLRNFGPLNKRLGLTDDMIKVTISPLRGGSPDLLPDYRRIAAYPEAYISKDGIMIPFLRSDDRKVRTFHAFARRVRRQTELAVDLALALDVFLRSEISIKDDDPHLDFLVGKVALSPRVLTNLSRPVRGLGFMRKVHSELIDILDLERRYGNFEEQVVMPYDAEEDVDYVNECLRLLGSGTVRRGRRALLVGDRARILRISVLKSKGDHIFPRTNEAALRVLGALIVVYLTRGRFSDLEELKRALQPLIISKEIEEFAKRVACRDPGLGLTVYEMEVLLTKILELREKVPYWQTTRLRWHLDDSLQRGGGGNLLKPLLAAGYLREGVAHRRGKCEGMSSVGRRRVRYYVPNYDEEVVRRIEREMGEFISMMRNVARDYGFNPDATSL